MKTKTFAKLLWVLVICLSSCTANRFVKPLEEKEKAVGVGFGGPLVEYGSASIPVPLVSVSGGYGVNDQWTAFGGFQMTSAAFSNLHVDLGAVRHLYRDSSQSWVPSLTFSPILNAVFDLNDDAAKLWPQVNLNAYWNYGKKSNYAYFSFNNWFELSPTRSFDQSTINNWVPVLAVGNCFGWKQNELSLEMKWMAPGTENVYVFVPWTSTFGQSGATGFYVNYVRKF